MTTNSDTTSNDSASNLESFDSQNNPLTHHTPAVSESNAFATSNKAQVTDSNPSANASETTIRTIELVFTGKGNDYFKIWITNLALTLITLGIYYPWAKARRQRYFWAHTVVDGHSLGFHGRPFSMFKGYAIAAVLSSVYFVLSKYDPIYAAVMLIFIALLYPILFRASMRFTLLNTSWRGLRFQFKANVKQAYQYLATAIVITTLVTVIPLVLISYFGDVVNPETLTINWVSYAAVSSISGLALAIGLPIAYFYMKKFQRDFYSYANIQTQFNGTPWGFYKIILKAICVSLLVSLAIGLFVLLFTLAQFIIASIFGSMTDSLKIVTAILMGVGVTIAYILYFSILGSYFSSRHFNFYWGNVLADGVRVLANLKLKPLVRLNIKNWILIVLTLGLYFPFAKIATTKMQVEALSIQTTLDFDRLVNDYSLDQQSNIGEAITDMFDFDFGF